MTGFSRDMPIVITQREGGPYDDVAYLAGWMTGALDTMLGFARPPVHQQPVYTACVPQVDLIAMRHGYTMISQPKDDLWSMVQLTRESELR